MFLSEFYSQMWNNSSCSSISIGVLKNVAKNSQLRLENERSRASEALTTSTSYIPEDEIPVTLSNGEIVNFAQCVQAFSQLDDDDSDTITVHDFSSGSSIQVHFEDVMNAYNGQLRAAEQLSTFMEVSANAVENAAITASEMFSDLRSLGYEVADYSQLKDLCTNLTSSSLSNDDKYQLIVNFTGLNQLYIDDDIGDQMMNPYNLYSQLSQYTGVSPISGLLSGIGEVIEGFANNVVDGVVSYAKWKVATVRKVVKKVVKWTGKLIGKAYRKAKTTYVDPVDVKVNKGDEFIFFDMFARTYSNSNYLSGGLRNYLSTHSCLRLSIFGNIYILYMDNDKIVIDEYIKPVDLTSAIQAVSGLGSFISVTSDGHTINSSITFNDVLEIIDTLSDAPTISANASEIDVYHGLCASKVAAASFATLGYYILTNDELYDMIFSLDDEVSNKCQLLYIWINDIIGLYDPIATNNVTLHYTNYAVNGCIFPSFKDKTSVSNTDFVKMLTGKFTDPGSNYPYDNQYTLSLTNSIVSSTYGMNTDYVNVPDYGLYEHDSMAYLLYVISSIFSNELNALKGVYIPYDHTSKVRVNSSVKTDRENIANAQNVTIGAIVAIALTATAIYLGPKVLAFRRKVKLDLYRNNRDSFKVAKLVERGEITQAQQLAKEMRKRVRIANIMGISDATALATASSLSINPSLDDSELLENLDSLSKLIK